MPNWCENDITITGSKEDIAALHELVGDEFDFDKIIPMPAALDTDGVGNTAGNTVVVCNPNTMVFHEAGKCRAKHVGIVERVRLRNTNNAAIAINNGYRPCKVCIDNPRRKRQAFDKPLDVGAALVKEFGFDNWYDWRIAHWGTKWGACEVNLNWGDTFVQGFFSTAWSPPEPIYNKLVDLFPNLDIKWHYNEPGCCFSGDFDTGVCNEFPDPCECGYDDCPECCPENFDEDGNEIEHEEV